MTPPFQALVAQALAPLESPPAILSSVEFPSFDDAMVIVDDGSVLWRLIRERSNVSLQAAAAAQSPEEWFDASLLEAVCLGKTTDEKNTYPTRTLESAVAQLIALRTVVRESFTSNWKATRRRLQQTAAQWNESTMNRPARFSS